MRSDLPLGVVAAQLVHAAGESAMDGRYLGIIHAVVLATKDEAQLEKLEVLLQRKGIAHVAIREPDPPYYGQLMAIGIEPTACRKVLRRLLSRYPLLRASSSAVARPSAPKGEDGGSNPSSPICGGSSTSRAPAFKLEGGGAGPPLRTNQIGDRE